MSNPSLPPSLLPPISLPLASLPLCSLSFSPPSLSPPPPPSSLPPSVPPYVSPSSSSVAPPVIERQDGFPQRIGEHISDWFEVSRELLNEFLRWQAVSLEQQTALSNKLHLNLILFVSL
ncbi:unnamed protein product [Boreogadus saida]